MFVLTSDMFQEEGISGIDTTSFMILSHNAFSFEIRGKLAKATPSKTEKFFTNGIARCIGVWDLENGARLVQKKALLRKEAALKKYRQLICHFP